MGDELFAMLQSAKSESPRVRESEITKFEAKQPNKATAALDCPSCGPAMVSREAKRGADAGSYFWGCVTYPKCRGTVSPQTKESIRFPFHSESVVSQRFSEERELLRLKF